MPEMLRCHLIERNRVLLGSLEQSSGEPNVRGVVSPNSSSIWVGQSAEHCQVTPEWLQRFQTLIELIIGALPLRKPGPLALITSVQDWPFAPITSVQDRPLTLNTFNELLLALSS